jgi:hypothetical protein
MKKKIILKYFLSVLSWAIIFYLAWYIRLETSSWLASLTPEYCSGYLINLASQKNISILKINLSDASNGYLP